MPPVLVSPAAQFPPTPGSYVLVMRLPNEKEVVVGRLGSNVFPAGYYLYVGSALGPGGLAGRLGRHLRPTDRPHWHIDYLRQHALIEEIWLTTSPERLEHAWSAAIGQLLGAAIPMPRFGASDCRCPAHLFYIAQKPNLAAFQAILEDHLSRESRQGTIGHRSTN